MADLKAMFAKKGPLPDKPADADVRIGNAILGIKPDDSTPTATPDAPAQEVQAAASDAPVATQAEAQAEPAPAAPVRKGLGFLGKGQPSAANGGSVAPTQAPVDAPKSVANAPTKPKLAGLGLGKPAAKPVEKVEAPTAGEVAAGEPVIDLQSLMDDESPAPARVARPLPADHVPATAPIRPVPEDATAPMLQFVKLIDSVYEMQFDQDLLGNVIKSIMVELQTNPAYISSDWKKSLVQPDDIRVWIRNMREVMGLNKIVKAEKKAKRASGKAKKVDSNEMLDDLASLGFTLEG
jgi:hypothetical protein